MDRRDDVDWLRVIATYMLFPFHVAMVFNPAPFYHVRNDEVTTAALVFCGFVGLWHMPLFFLLAGWSLARSLAQRGRGNVVRERLLRLGVPLVAGCVLLMPVIKWIELRGGLDANADGLFVAPHLQASFRSIFPRGLPEMAAPFTQPFVEFLPTFFTDLRRFTWAHLWFVAYLLTFTLLYLPLVVRLAKARLEPQSRGWVYAPIVPLVLIQVILRPYWPGLQNLIDDWANFAYYTTYLFCGVALASSPRLDVLVEREWRRALAIALVTTLVLLAGVLGVFQVPAVMLAGSGVAGWCFVVAIVGAGRTYLAWSSPLQRWLVESAFPVYLLHQSAIVLLGYWIVGLPLGVGAKLALLLVGSVVVTLAVYELLVRRFALPRFLCGMKGRPRPTRATSRLSAATTGALLLVVVAPAVASGTPLGRWYAEGGAAQVTITPCDDALCGTVTWLRSPYDDDGCELRDAQNPEPALRTRPILGLRVLSALRPSVDAAATWSGGDIYDPSSGRTYRCTLRLTDPDRLEVRGYLGVPLLGRTTHWIRVDREAAVCRARTLVE